MVFDGGNASTSYAKTHVLRWVGTYPVIDAQLLRKHIHELGCDVLVVQGVGQHVKRSNTLHHLEVGSQHPNYNAGHLLVKGESDTERNRFKYVTPTRFSALQ